MIPGLIPTRGCPLCTCRDARPHSAPLPNLYSEMLAGLTGTEEAVLLAAMANVQCEHCGLIYKDRWFAGAVLRRLFSERVPAHPRGWDVVSRRYSPENFQAEVSAYARAMDEGDAVATHRFRRALTSILDSIPASRASEPIQALRRHIASGYTGSLQGAAPLLRATMREPVPFGRFSGFSAPQLWDYLLSRIGKIDRYAEVGCPLWGLLSRAAADSAREVHLLQRAEPNYWSSGCVQDGLHCLDHRLRQTDVAVFPWDARPSAAYDLMGVFQYLDHLTCPADFVEELFERSRAAAIILDHAEESVGIQHFTGWTRRTMHWLAEHHRCRLHEDFNEILPSGNRLFLLVKT